jgi:hypothetical protein
MFSFHKETIGAAFGPKGLLELAGMDHRNQGAM